LGVDIPSKFLLSRAAQSDRLGAGFGYRVGERHADGQALAPAEEKKAGSGRQQDE